MSCLGLLKNTYYLFIWLLWVLVALGSSVPIRDWTWATCVGSTESQPLDHQGSHWPGTFYTKWCHSEVGMYGWWDEPGSERSERETEIWVLSTSVGWIMTLKMLTSSSLQPENITFCGKRDFTGGINLKVLRCFVLWAQYNYRHPLMWWLFSH